MPQDNMEKSENVLCTRCPLWLTISHILYISTAMTAAGSTHQHPRPPPGQRASTPNSPAPQPHGKDRAGGGINCCGCDHTVDRMYLPGKNRITYSAVIIFKLRTSFPISMPILLITLKWSSFVRICSS